MQEISEPSMNDDIAMSEVDDGFDDIIDDVDDDDDDDDDENDDDENGGENDDDDENDNDVDRREDFSVSIPKNKSDDHDRKHNNNEDITTNTNTTTMTFLAVSSSSLSFHRRMKVPDTKHIIFIVLGGFLIIILWESFFVNPDDRWIQPDFSDRFLRWVELNPRVGMGAILIVIAAAVVSMVPIGTPLTVGCGYIYRGVYGWKLGILVSTVVSMAGSALGAVTCFLLGRYLMRDTVKRWVKNYPMFHAIDIAVSEQGLKIMAMLYLTPVLPLGLVSYMCGTTAMDIYSFVLAKIASLPIYLMYTFMGASAHSFIQGGKGSSKNNNDIGKSLSAEAKKLEENRVLILFGLVLSIIMMALITRNIQKELMKILDQQKKEKVDETATTTDELGEEKTIEMGLTSRRKKHTKNIS